MQPFISRNTYRASIVLATLLIFASAVGAQTITDARRVEFTPSAEHNAVDGSGVPILTRYSLQLFLAGGATALQTVDLGKPAPETDGLIRLDFVSLLGTPLTPGVLYETLVESVGPGGRSPSLRSNTFSFTDPCVRSISPTSQSFTATGGTGTSGVTTATGCAWTALSNSTWITVTAGASGSGNGTVTFTVAANTAATSRVGTLTVAGGTFTVTQAAACAYAISPASQSSPATGDTGSSAVTTTTGCTWAATSNNTWISVTAGSSGSGNGTVTFTVATNTVATARTGTLTIAGRPFTVTQAAACAYTISPTSQSLPATGGTGSSAVTTTTGCTWTATSGASWVTIATGATGTGNGSATFTVAANTTTVLRSATLTIAGRVFTVTEAAAACTFTVSPLAITESAAGGSGTITVTAQSGCAWSSVNSATWITLTGSGSGSGTAAYTIAANTGLTTRTAAIIVAGRTINVTQAALTPPGQPSNVRIIR